MTDDPKTGKTCTIVSASNIGTAEDLIVGLSAIAKEVGVTAEGVRHLWREGRIPAVHFGPLWLANRSALTQALVNELVRRPRGRRTKEEEMAREAICQPSQMTLIRTACHLIYRIPRLRHSRPWRPRVRESRLKQKFYR